MIRVDSKAKQLAPIVIYYIMLRHSFQKENGLKHYIYV